MYNPKRSIAPLPEDGLAGSSDAVASVRYGGNPEHKRRPGDYGPTPPASPRPGKTLCDAEQEFPRNKALGLLKEGLRRGMVSTKVHGQWPQNVWAVDSDGTPFEAQLENSEAGVYHGYPMAANDDFRNQVISEWNKRGK